MSTSGFSVTIQVMITVKIKKLDPDLKDNAYAKHMDAGFDLFARERTVVAPGARTAVPTGIAMEIPEGCVGLIWDKSGLSIKHGIKTLGGVIDAGYRGEVLVGLTNLGDREYVFEKGDKVAQIIYQKFEQATLEFVDELTESERGDTGFGSSGK